MSIDRSGKWWKGTAPEDIAGFLTAYADEGYEVAAFRLARCACGSVEFKLDADDDEGAARRTCTRCGTAHFICDSDDAWEEAEPESWTCVECTSDRANVGCGFSLRDGGDVRWIYVGVRCASCGVLGCFAGWGIDYGPSGHLLDEV
ncbi:MAG: hypothetical protein H6709_02005 [Kofleriaceae bacterium]|nr:hypothetical protein [Myxococcales bacterium]MCA9857400.1 hypothetical protein [Dehalococcoidia bacterium]MCB9570844.1 hypothetical protein [Kofleriaceae bacterium]